MYVHIKAKIQSNKICCLLTDDTGVLGKTEQAGLSLSLPSLQGWVKVCGMLLLLRQTKATITGLNAFHSSKPQNMSSKHEYMYDEYMYHSCTRRTWVDFYK